MKYMETQFPYSIWTIITVGFEYNRGNSSLVTENGISMNITIANKDINLECMNKILDKFQNYVQKRI
jgi:hypothetical protein